MDLRSFFSVRVKKGLMTLLTMWSIIMLWQHGNNGKDWYIHFVKIVSPSPCSFDLSWFKLTFQLKVFIVQPEGASVPKTHWWAACCLLKISPIKYQNDEFLVWARARAYHREMNWHLWWHLLFEYRQEIHRLVCFDKMHGNMSKLML